MAQQNWRELRGYSDKQIVAADAALSRKSACLLYGGAGYGGKSDFLRSFAVELNGRLKESGFPAQWGILFCKIGEDLKKRHLKVLESEYCARHFNPVDRKTEVGWSIPLGKIGAGNMGLRFEFADPSMGGFYLAHLEDADRYRSAEFAWGMIDELTECTRDDYGKVRYCVRSPFELPFAPIVAASNPDGIGASWVRKLWIDRDFSGSDDDAFDADDFIYVEALPTDNPTWRDTMAKTQFAGLDAAVRHARLTGSWETIAGVRFPMFSHQDHVFRMTEKFPHGLPVSWRKYRAVDYGYGAPYCCLWFAVDPDGDVYVYREDYGRGYMAREQAERIISLTPDGEVIDCSYLDPSMWQTLGREVGAPTVVAQTYSDAGLRNLIGGNTKDRADGWLSVENFLMIDNGHPTVFFEESCVNVIRQVRSLPLDRRTEMLAKKGDTDPRAEDHAADALRIGLHTYLNPSEKKLQIPGSDASLEEKQRHMEKSNERFWKDIDYGSSRDFARRMGSGRSRRR